MAHIDSFNVFDRAEAKLVLLLLRFKRKPWHILILSMCLTGQKQNWFSYWMVMAGGLTNV
jgi:hypothetical protein